MYKITISMYPDSNQGDKDKEIAELVRALWLMVPQEAFFAAEVYQGTRRVHSACR